MQGIATHRRAALDSTVPAGQSGAPPPASLRPSYAFQSAARPLGVNGCRGTLRAGCTAVRNGRSSGSCGGRPGGRGRRPGSPSGASARTRGHSAAACQPAPRRTAPSPPACAAASRTWQARHCASTPSVRQCPQSATAWKPGNGAAATHAMLALRAFSRSGISAPSCPMSIPARLSPLSRSLAANSRSHSCSCCSTSSRSSLRSMWTGTRRPPSSRTSSSGISTRRRSFRSMVRNVERVTARRCVRGKRETVKSSSILPLVGMPNPGLISMAIPSTLHTPQAHRVTRGRASALSAATHVAL